MSKNKITVIVPIYNKEKYIEECINSLTNQTLQEIEIICINDGSTDNSKKIIESISKKEPKIKIINQKNKGPGHARNQGLKNAKGEYIAFIDADDWIEQNTLENLYKKAKKDNSDLVLFNAIEHLPENKTRKRIYYPETIEKPFNYQTKKDIVMNNYLIVCTKLHKRKFLENNQIQFLNQGLFEDVYFHIKSTIKAEKISYINEILYNYRRTQKNTRQTQSLKSKESFIFIDTLEEVKKLLIKEKVYTQLEENFLQLKLRELKNILENTQQQEEFFKILKKNFKQDNISPQTLKKLNIEEQKFYNNITQSENIQEYKNRTNKKKKEENKIKKLIKKFF